MTLQTISIGQNPNDGTGDPVRTAFSKTNANVNELSTRATTAQASADAAQATASAAVARTQMGAADGVAPLGADSKIPAAYMPAYVDDVLEFDALAAFPVTGEQGKIYVAQDTNRIYRWSGAVYVELSPYPEDTDAVPEGTGNLYFTQPRVITALTENAEAARSALGVYSEGQTIPIFTAANIPLSQVGPIYVQGVGSMEWNATTGRYEMVQREHGNCRFQSVSASECRLYPFNGNGLIINGRQYRIPVSGVPLASTAAATNGNYVYAADNGSGGLKLEASTTGHTRYADGTEIKIGDPSRILVGYAWKNGSGNFQNDTTIRGVSSWFNTQHFVAGSTAFSSTTSSNTFVQIITPNYVYAWAGDSISYALNGYCFNNVAGNSCYVQLVYDGTPAWTQVATSATSGAGVPLSMTLISTPTEGLHYVSVSALVTTTASVGTFNVTQMIQTSR
ncbi:hypothetical protein [Bordetella sp. LUAb4]|uniref:hypothetical protein n=1 Tax=Bordetella sp. LUAb4 TaxID=2843195 RepID=UPI001E3E40C5|nr:hypothetical protein [Bordetella sp. LUAb4]